MQRKFRGKAFWHKETAAYILTECLKKNPGM